MSASQCELEKYQPEQHGIESKKGGINNACQRRGMISPHDNTSRYERQDNADDNAEKPAGIIGANNGNRGG